jgi:ankyrin repeat protein
MAPRSAWPALWLALLAMPAAQLAVAAPPARVKSFGKAADPLEGVKSAIRLKKFSAAQSDLQPLAEAGNADAQYLLAAFYLNGLAGPRDPVKAKLWLEKSAAQGNSHAAFSLASLYADSDPPDPQAAERWLARARELGFTPQTRSGATAVGTAADSIVIPAARITDPKVKREALWLAAEQGDVASLEALASATLVTETDEFGRGALARAAEAGQASALELLLRRGAAVDNADRYGMTALMLAARAGSTESVEALIRSKGNVNAVDHKGNTVLMHAAAGGKVAVVERLLAAGAGVAPRNVQDWSALDFAEVGGAREAAARLREKGATALKRSAAISEPALTTVQRAAQGRDLYAGWPDLAVAAARKAPELLQTLLTRGADPNAKTPQGTPVLGVAVVSGAPATVETLLGAGAQATQSDRRGSSALLVATREGREDMVAALPRMAAQLIPNLR